MSGDAPTITQSQAQPKPDGASAPKVTLQDGTTLTRVELRNKVRAAGAKTIDETKFLEVLVVNGLLTAETLPTFVSAARNTGSSLTAHAVSSRVMREADLARILARAHNVPLVENLGALEIPPALLERLETSHAQRLSAVVIGEEPAADGKPERLVIAVADPSDAAMVEELRRLVGAEVEIRVASADALREILDGLAQGESEAQEQLEEVGNETVQQDFRASGGSADSMVVSLANAIIAQARDQGASDIHIEPSPQATRIRYRIDGVLSDVRSVPNPVHERLVSRVKVIANLKIDEKRAPQDGRTTFQTPRGPVDLRVATLPTVFGERITMRLLDPSQSKLGLGQLGLGGRNLETVNDAVTRPHGLCITTGPTGSGKSTTLYSMLHILNDRVRNIITVEDPVEQKVEGLNQVQTAERANLTFATALRSILRSDPDVIMIGEIRDQETAKIAVESAMTGHLVLTTLHTNSAAAAVTRLMEMGVEPFLIADACHMIMAQRLARVLCRYCRVEREADADLLRRGRAPEWVIAKAESEGPIKMFKALEGGCPRCRERGYSGRIGIHEVMALDGELKEMVMRVASADELAAAAIAAGMTTLRDDGYAKVLDGTTSLEEIARVVN